MSADNLGSPDKEILVKFERVQKSYDGEILVVKNLNLDIPKGEFITMLGPSGSGKTTSLMMVAGFEPATSGEIYLAGKPVNNVPPHKRNIGMVFQNYALFPHMTVSENLAFPLKVRKQSASEIKDRVTRALEMVELPQFGNRFPAQLSGGQQQRVAVARALVFEPDIVLMDEPLGALDKNLREQMQYEIKHLHENLGITVIYVTHDQTEALTMSDRVAVFNDGVVQQLAPPDILYEQPDNSFVAQFIGENNKLIGTVESVDGDSAAVRLENGDIVNALPVNINGVGSKTQLSIRPERLAIGSDIPDGVPILDAKVEEVIYLGDHIRTRMTVAGNSEFVAKVRNRPGLQRATPGEMLKVGWDTVDCRALDA